jgi:hypothetical protein
LGFQEVRLIRATFKKKEGLWFCGDHGLPAVKLDCTIMWGEKHGARKEMGSSLALPPVHCGTFTESASFCLFSQLVKSVIILLRLMLTANKKR